MTFGKPHNAKEDDGSPRWIPGYWQDQDVYILGSGPSLIGFDFERLRGKNSIACVHTINFSQHSEFMVILDNEALQGLSHKPGPDAPFHTIASQSVCGAGRAMHPNKYMTHVRAVRKRTNNIMDGAYSGYSTGYYATSIALAMGAKRIFLLGHDACALNGRTHFYDTMQVKKHVPTGGAERYERFKHGWQAFAGLKNIYNCSDISAVSVFPKISIDEALND